ncbi:hypothetical protein Y032_0011g1294 [Ancylostoma ceylanicum]|uniref:Uncharacterized protein n=1 Tax=Ancylostoma ceylanicum TaxID=53326 RepID=A0A016VDY9_9BILA|nr:hypothetical protein Y032_0011g1294 [Ancylostoma ceylanicum]
MVCHVQFNHDNPYHKPWSLVNLVRELQEHEELPNRAEPDSRVGSHGHHGQRGYETDDERFTGRDHLNANHRHGKPSSDPSHNRRHHCPQLEEALDIIGRLLDSYEISRAIDRRSPWLLPRMRRLVSSCGEGGRRSDRESHYGSDTSSYAVSDEESRRRPRGHDY